MNAIQVQNILNRKQHRDPYFLEDYTLNPYSGCSFNCQFCYIRGSKYGLHMERRSAFKQNAVELLRKALSVKARKNQYGLIVMASSTDPYMHAEADLKLTRQLLEVMLEFRFPVHIITRSNLVTRDIDLIERLNEKAILPPALQGKLSGGAIVTFSFSTVDPLLAHQLEPGATPVTKRLDAMKTVASHNLTVGAAAMPLLPYLTDTEEQMRELYSALKAHGAQYAMPGSLTLHGRGRSDSKTLIFKLIRKEYPDIYGHYVQLYERGEMELYQSLLSRRFDEMAAEFDLPQRIISGI